MYYLSYYFILNSFGFGFSFAKDTADSYQSLVKILYGKNIELIIIITIIFYTFGTCSTYLVIIGDQFEPIFEEYM